MVPPPPPSSGRYKPCTTGIRTDCMRRGEALLKAEEYADAVQRVLAKDFYVTPEGVAIPTKRMAKAAGVIS